MTKRDEGLTDYGSHKQGPVPKNIITLSERTRKIKILDPTMFEDMGRNEEG